MPDSEKLLPVFAPGASLPALADGLKAASAVLPAAGGGLSFQARDPNTAPAPVRAAGRSTAEVASSGAAEQWWETAAGGLLSLFHSGSAAGSCTDFASTYRLDIIEDYQEWLYDNFGQAQAQIINWQAWQWIYNSYYCGHPIGWWPVYNSIICFQPGAYGAGSIGHVGIVEAVGSDNSFIIGEMNFPNSGVISYRWFSAQTAVAMAQSFPQVSFIY